MTHVLVIEDEPMVAMALEDILLEAGADTVAIAGTEKAAIEAASTHRPDFITSDVRLKQGTGPAAVASIRDQAGHIPVLFITATPDECEPCDRGFVIAKPFTPEMVAETFRIALR